MLYHNAIQAQLREARVVLEVTYRRRRLAALANPDPTTNGVRWDMVDDEGYTDYESAHLHAVFIAAGHGYTVTEQKRRPLGLTLTCFCGSPIIYARGLSCEFPVPWDDCRCNACILNLEPTTKPKVYCSDKCKYRMRLAMNRARRRAEGKATRAVDDVADPIADMVVKRVYPNPRNKQEHLPTCAHYP